VKRDTRDAPLSGFRRMIFPVSDHGMADGRELDADLILQACLELDPDQRCSAKFALDDELQFSAGSFPVALAAQLLEHPFAPEEMQQTSFVLLELSANHGKILPQRFMREELPHQGVAISLGLGEQQYAGGEAIDAMDDECPLPVLSQFCRKHRERRRHFSVSHRNRGKAGRLIKSNHGIVLVQHAELAR